MDNEAVFIVGCPRTGSTLLRQLLNKSPRVCITSESHYMRRISHVGKGKALRAFGNLHDEANVERLLDFLYSPAHVAARGYWGWFTRDVPRDAFRTRFLATDRGDRALFALLMQLYAEDRRGSSGPEMILGEKTPTNFYYLPTLMEWFPRAKVIHTFRDPRAIFVSAARLVRAGKWGVRERLPALPPWVMHPLLDTVELMHITQVWFDAVRLHATYERRYAERYHLLRFEDLMDDPATALQGICDFLQIPFDPAMLEEIAVVGSSFRERRRVQAAGLDPRTAARWREHIHPLAGAWFSILGRKHLQRFDYLP